MPQGYQNGGPKPSKGALQATAKTHSKFNKIIIEMWVPIGSEMELKFRIVCRCLGFSAESVLTWLSEWILRSKKDPKGSLFGQNGDLNVSLDIRFWGTLEAASDTPTVLKYVS